MLLKIQTFVKTSFKKLQQLIEEEVVPTAEKKRSPGKAQQVYNLSMFSQQ